MSPGITANELTTGGIGVGDAVGEGVSVGSAVAVAVGSGVKVGTAKTMASSATGTATTDPSRSVARMPTLYASGSASGATTDHCRLSPMVVEMTAVSFTSTSTTTLGSPEPDNASCACPPLLETIIDSTAMGANGTGVSDGAGVVVGVALCASTGRGAGAMVTSCSAERLSTCPASSSVPTCRRNRPGWTKLALNSHRPSSPATALPTAAPSTHSWI